MKNEKRPFLISRVGTRYVNFRNTFSNLFVKVLSAVSIVADAGSGLWFGSRVCRYGCFWGVAELGEFRDGNRNNWRGCCRFGQIRIVDMALDGRRNRFLLRLICRFLNVLGRGDLAKLDENRPLIGRQENLHRTNWSLSWFRPFRSRTPVGPSRPPQGRDLVLQGPPFDPESLL